MSKVFILVLALIAALPVRAQVVLSAGSSTLFSATGGGVTLYQGENTYAVGAADAGGRFVLGGYESRPFRDYMITTGSQSIGYSFNGASLSVPCLGVSFAPRWTPKPKRYHVSGFLGAIGSSFASPWSPGALPSHIGVGVLGDYKVGHNATLYTLDAIAGGHHTLTQGLAYSTPHFGIAATGGLLDNRRFLNAGTTYRNKGLTATAQHYTFFYPIKSVGDFASASQMITPNITISGGASESHTAKDSAVGENAGASFQFGRLTNTVIYYRSTSVRGRNQFLNDSIDGRISQHLSVNVSVNESNGNMAYALGGGLSIKRVQVRLGHNIAFTVFGYEQVTSISVGFRVHDTQVTAQTITLPNGSTKWTTDTTTYVQKQFTRTKSFEGGKYVAEGTCVDESNSPVEGCAIQIILDKKRQDFVYTNAHGRFQYRTKVKEVTIMVLPEEFLNGGYTVVAAPIKVVNGSPAKIVVRRKTASGGGDGHQ